MIRQGRLGPETVDRPFGILGNTNTHSASSRLENGELHHPVREPFMATTRTPGMTIVAGGLRFIDNRHRGVRIAMRVGNISQEQAEQRLQSGMSRVDCEIFRKAHARPHFIDCAPKRGNWRSICDLFRSCLPSPTVLQLGTTAKRSTNGEMKSNGCFAVWTAFVASSLASRSST